MRLIDRDLLLKAIEKSRDSNLHRDSKIRANHIIEHNHIIHLVMEQSTAFDVEKVVEQLREEIGDCKCDWCDVYTDCDTCRAEKAIEIIKSALGTTT